jgi:tRNA(Ile)-lysidine synthase
MSERSSDGSGRSAMADGAAVVRALRQAVAAAFARPLAQKAGAHWLVACSGGPDSTALLDALEAIAPAHGLQLHVASVDHGMRVAAAEEAATVVSGVLRRGIAATVLRVHVPGGSMAAARRARYDALVAEARRVGAGGIAVAHTATDQAETLLDRLVRGAGARGLGAMACERFVASRDGESETDAALVLARPLLSIARVDIEHYVRARNLYVVRDPTNEDLHYRRSRMRHEVLPLLRRERPDLDRALAETCDRLRAEADALDAVADDAYRRLQLAAGHFDAAGLAALPEALFARVIGRAAGVPLGAVHVAALARLCADRRGTRSVDLPGGRRAERRYEQLRLGAQSQKSAPNVTREVAVGSAGLYLLEGMPVEISEDLYEALGASSLTLRFVRPGDRMRRRKLQDVLVDAKVPRPERARTPLLARGSDVVWVQGLRLTGKGAVQ